MALKIFDNIKSFKNVLQLNKTAMSFIAQISYEAIRKKGRFNLALSGGKTPLGLYKLLGKKTYTGKINFNKTHFFWVDERFVPSSSNESNFGMFCNILKCKNKLSSKNLHNINTDFKNSTLSASNYENNLKKYFGNKKIPQFDLIILGIGSEGHIASLFPNSENLKETKKWVLPIYVKKERIKKRITLTMPVLNNAKNILFLVSGKTKKNILNKILSLKKSTSAYPVTLIKSKKYLFTD
jgi:6-phosphogluconolactonase